VVGGAMYLLITVGSVFLGKKIQTPDFKHVPVKQGMAPPPAPVAVAPAGHGTIGLGGFVALKATRPAAPVAESRERVWRVESVAVEGSGRPGCHR